jgi:hypothetical protein
MPTLDDLPTLVTNVNPSGADLIPVYDVDSPSSSKVEKLPLSGILGLQPTDVATMASGTISTRLTVATGSGLTLPVVSGNLRQVIVMNLSGGPFTLTAAGTDKIVSAASQVNPSIPLASGHAAILLSDGTRWYHISNDT